MRDAHVDGREQKLSDAEKSRPTREKHERAAEALLIERYRENDIEEPRLYDGNEMITASNGEY